MQLITKFNTLIRSRILWGAFAIVISISFVGAFSQTRGCNDKSAEDGEGILFGETVSPSRFAMARHFLIGLRDTSESKLPDAATIRQMTWRRLGMLKLAQRLQISANDQEVANEIRRMRVFSDAYNAQGKLDDARYRDIVERAFKLDVQAFHQYLREQLVLQKLTGLLGFAVWTPPFESMNMVRNYMDNFSLQYAFLSPTNMVTPPALTAGAAEAYFKTHTNEFLIPEKRSVCYVAFAIPSLTNQVPLSDSEIKTYYNDHAEDYVERGTNGIETPIPIEKVTNDINRIVMSERLKTKAEAEATRFVDLLTSDRYGKGVTFFEAAAKINAPVHTSELFSVQDSIPGLDVSPEFNQMAFSLDPTDPDRLFSDPLTQSNAVYVMFFHTDTQPRIPEFSEVATRVMPLAQTNAIEEAFVEAVKTAKDKVRKSLDAGKSFRNAVDNLALHLNVSTTRPFNVYEVRMQDYGGDTSNQVAYAHVFARNVMDRDPGELMDPVEVEGGTLLAYVADRVPGNLTELDQMKAGMVREIDRSMSGLLVDGWGDQILKMADFKDFRPIRTNDLSTADDSVDETPRPRPSRGRKFDFVD
jgi:hypothetical protein